MNRHAWTGMHEPACMHADAAAAAAACVRAYVVARVISAQTRARRRPGRGESNFRVEIFVNIRRGQKDELETPCPELVLLSAPNIHEYFYTKIRFSTPALSALLPLAGQICLS
jgi:hypothetical protein